MSTPTAVQRLINVQRRLMERGYPIGRILLIAEENTEAFELLKESELEVAMSEQLGPAGPNKQEGGVSAMTQAMIDRANARVRPGTGWAAPDAA